jgi:hypothetical protein
MATSEQDGALMTAPDGAIPPGWYQIGHNPNRQTYWTGAVWSGQRQWSAGAGWQETNGSNTAVSKRQRRDQSKVRKLWGAGILAVLLVGGAVLGVVALNAHSSKDSHTGKGANATPTALVAPSVSSSTTTTLPAPLTTAPIP